MKTLTLLLALTAFAATAQTIRIADNNANRPTGANVYPTLQGAIDAAAPDDIVYITPSTNSYGDVTVGKRITIKGVGHGITEIAPRISRLGTLTIVNSSNGVDNVSGLVLTSFSFSLINFALGTGGSSYNNITLDNISGGEVNHTTCLPNVDMLVIKNSYVTAITLGNCSALTNLSIYKNVIDGARQVGLNNCSNLLITNNLFFTVIDPFGNQFMTISSQNSTPARIEHNVFSGNGPTFQNLSNTVVVNNIFFGKTPASGVPGSIAFTNNTFSNNLVLDSFTMPPASIGGVANSGIGNITGTGPLFTSAAVTSTWAASVNNNYTLQPSSVCIGAATTGENIGPSGGLYPWTGNLTLKPSNVPVITLFGNSGVVPQNQPVKSNIKAKAN
jgi:hypothetical protein